MHTHIKTEMLRVLGNLLIALLSILRRNGETLTAILCLLWVESKPSLTHPLFTQLNVSLWTSFNQHHLYHFTHLINDSTFKGGNTLFVLSACTCSRENMPFKKLICPLRQQLQSVVISSELWHDLSPHRLRPERDFHSNSNKAHPIQQLDQGCPTLFQEIYHHVGFHSSPNKAHIIEQLEQWFPTGGTRTPRGTQAHCRGYVETFNNHLCYVILFENHQHGGTHGMTNRLRGYTRQKRLGNTELEHGCPTLFLEIYQPVGFHSNPNKAHLIQQLE